MQPVTLTAKALAQYLGWSRSHLYNQLKDGRFPVPPIPGDKWPRWNIEEVNAWRLDGTVPDRPMPPRPIRIDRSAPLLDLIGGV